MTTRRPPDSTWGLLATLLCVAAAQSQQLPQLRLSLHPTTQTFLAALDTELRAARGTPVAAEEQEPDGDTAASIGLVTTARYSGPGLWQQVGCSGGCF